MNYNYNNFGQYPYNYMQPQQNAYQPQQQTTQYIPLTFVSGIEGAKAFIVAPNQTVYLRDSDSETLFVKTADMQGRYTLKVYNLIPIEEAQKNLKTNYVTLESLNALKQDFEEKMNQLSLEIEKLTGGKKNE